MLQNISLYSVSIWVIPLLVAITFHEAAHGFVAYRLGDNTAFNSGAQFQSAAAYRSVRHPILPAILLLSHSPFLLATPNRCRSILRALRNPRFGMVLVALAGLRHYHRPRAAGGAGVSWPRLRARRYRAMAGRQSQKHPRHQRHWLCSTCTADSAGRRAGRGRIAAEGGGGAAVPAGAAAMLIPIGFLIILPLAGSQFGLNLDVISAILRQSTGYAPATRGDRQHVAQYLRNAKRSKYLTRAAITLIARCRADTRARADYDLEDDDR